MKAKKVIIPIVAIVAILAVLGGVFAGLWFFTDLFNFLKPANEVFSNQLEKALNIEGAKFSDYSDFLKDYKDIAGKPYKSNINMTAKLNLKDVDSNTEKIINNSKIKIESNSDTANKKAQNKIGLYTNNSEVLTLDLITNDSKMGIGCKDLYDKYLVLTAEDLVKLMKKQGEISASEAEALLNSFSGSTVDPYELLYISDKDLKHFDETYRNCLTKLISKDCFSSKKNVEVEVDGKDVKTTAYYLTLTGKDTYKFIENLTDLVKDDSVLSGLITEKANLMLKSSGQKEIDEDTVKDYIEKFADSMLEEMEDIKDSDESAIQIAIYSQKSKPVRIELNSIKDVEDLDEKETALSIEFAKSKDDDFENKTIYTIYQKGKAAASIVDNYTSKSKEERKGKVTIKVNGMSVGTVDYEFVNKEKETKFNVSLNVPLADLSANIKLSTNGNYKKEPVDIEGLIDFKYSSQSAEIKFDGTVEYTDDVSIPELNSSNSFDILKASNDELNTELEKIMKKASEVLPSRLKLIGVNVTSEDIYPTKKDETNTSDATENTESIKLNLDKELPTNINVPNVDAAELQKQIETNQKLLDSLTR